MAAATGSGPPAMEGLLAMLPASGYLDYLIIQYFTYIEAMYPVLHEDNFQKRYNAFALDPATADLPWLALLFAMLSLSVQVMEPTDPILDKVRERIQCPQDVDAMASELRRIALVCLEKDDFMFRYDLVTLETLLILVYGISHDDGVDAAWTLLGKSTHPFSHGTHQLS